MKKHYARIVRKVKSKAKPRSSKLPRVCFGIDASLIGHAIAVIDSEGKVEWVNGWTNKKTTQKKHPQYLSYYKASEESDRARLLRIGLMFAWTVAMIEVWRENCEVVVAIEGYAFAGKGNRASDLHELSGMIKHWLLANEIPFRIYQPASIKKAWTGAGNADKALMQMACYKLTDMDFTEITQGGDGLADAVLIGMLLHHELAIKDDLEGIKQLPKHVRAQLLNTTKAEPIAFISRPLITGGYKNEPPVMGNYAGPSPLDF